MNYNFYIKITEVIFRITFNDRKLFDALKNYFYLTKLDGEAEFEIFVRSLKKDCIEKRFQIVNNRKIEIRFPNGKLTQFKLSRLHYALIGAVGYLSLTKNLFLLHASSFVKNNKSYIFSAPSGGGKTTIVKKIKRSKLLVLADDVVIIKKIKRECFVCSSPFEKRQAPLIREKIPIATIYFLHQSKNNMIKTLNYSQRLKKLIYNHILFPFGDYRKIMSSNEIRRLSTMFKKTKKQKEVVLLLKLAQSIAAAVPIYELFFTKDTDFLKRV